MSRFTTSLLFALLIITSTNPSIINEEDIHEAPYIPRSWFRSKNAFPPIIVAPPLDRSGSCISRGESTQILNRRSQSLAFKQVIKDYKKKVSLFNEETLLRSLEGRIDSPKDIDNRFIIYSTLTKDCGLGNRILPIISAMLLALLTDRVLLINFDGYNIDDIFCDPLEGVKWSLPTNLSWTKISSQRTIHAETIQNSIGPYKLAYLKVADTNPSSHEILICGGDLIERWSNIQILYIQSNVYFVPLIFSNPIMGRKALELFPDKNVASLLVPLLFHPRDFIWKSVMETLEKLKSYNGIQARSFNKDQPNFELWIENIQACIRKDEMAPENLFVASLYQQIGKGLRELEWNAYQKYADGRQTLGWPQAARAVHDIWVLSKSANLYLSKFSTMGYVALSLHGKGGFFLSSETLDGNCLESLSHEPCSHLPLDQLKLCSGIDFTNQQLFMPCEDTRRGFKLKIDYKI